MNEPYIHAVGGNLDPGAVDKCWAVEDIFCEGCEREWKAVHPRSESVECPYCGLFVLTSRGHVV